MSPVTHTPGRTDEPRRGLAILRGLVGLALVAVIAIGIVACGSTADASCSEFAGMDSDEQRQVSGDLLKENDVETDGFGGSLAIGATRSALQAYCSQADGSEKVSDVPDRVVEGIFSGLGS